MKDFKSIIRDKYEHEVQPHFTDDAWNSFVLKAGLKPEKKKKRIGWWWIFGFILLGLSIPFILEFKSNLEQPITEEYKEIIADAGEVKPITNSEEDIKSETVDNDTSLTSQGTITGSPTSLTNVDLRSQSVPAFSTMLTVEAKEEIGERTLPNDDLKERSVVISNDIRNNEVISGIDVINQTIQIQSLEHISHQERKIQVYNPSISRYSIQVLAGSGFTDHQAVNAEQYFHLQSNLNLHLSNRISIMGSIGYFSNEFNSKVIYQNLGLRASDYQTRSTRLDRITRNTSNLELAIGLNLNVISARRFNFLASSSLSYDISLNEGLTYDFKNGETLISDGENIVIDDNSRLGLRIGTGLRFSITENFGIISSFFLQKSIAQSPLSYPIQYRWAIGIEKKW